MSVSFHPTELIEEIVIFIKVQEECLTCVAFKFIASFQSFSLELCTIRSNNFILNLCTKF